MSIKGFIVNGQTVKYDYQSLDNLPSFSLGIDQLDGLAYIYVNGEKQGTGIEVGGSIATRYSVTYNLTNASSSETGTVIVEGSTYTTTITPSTGYGVDSVVVTMGGSTVSGAYDSGTGVITVSDVDGNIVITVLTSLLPIDLLNVTWANHAVTCGQSTDNYNAWSPHNLQYDDVNDCFVFLQCHCDKHNNHTYTNWTLSIIDPYHPSNYTNVSIPERNGLGMLFVENGVWTLMPRNQSYAYRSNDMGATWTTLQANIPQYLFGVYKCGDTYFGGDDKNSGLKYHKSTDLLTWTDETFDSSLGYTTLCETTFAEFDGKYWAFNRTNDSTLGHPVILQSTDEGETWTLFSDQMLHGYRSTVSCYPFQNYLVIADIDRDNGYIYYSKFDGETITQLNSWMIPYGGDDFHNINIASNYQDTVILEFMHCAPFSPSTYQVYNTGYACDNVMLVGSTKSLPSLDFSGFIDTQTDMVAYANAHWNTGVRGNTYTWSYSGGGSINISSAPTTFEDEIELPLNFMQLVRVDASQLAWFANEDSLVWPWSNQRNQYPNQYENQKSSLMGIVSIGNIRYIYMRNRTGELPILIRAPYLCEFIGSSSAATNTIYGQSWQEELGFRRFIPINYGAGTLAPWSNSIFNRQNTHSFGFMTYTPVSDEASS